MSVKVVCVGLPRTGTQSMADALTVLGYTVAHEALPDLEIDLTTPVVLDELTSHRDCDVLMDATLWDLVIEANANAKVVLTYRDRGEWWKSIHGHVDRLHARCTVKQTREDLEAAGHIHAALFGSRWPQEGLYLHRYDLHRKTVEMFCDKIDRPLLIHEAADGWEPLCKFLDKPIPNEPYPRRNVSPMPPLAAIEHRDG